MTMDFNTVPPPHLDNSGCHSDTPAWWNFVFPNGRGANVWLSKWPFRFDMEFDGLHGFFTASSLTTVEVEAKLTEVAALPAPAEVAS